MDKLKARKSLGQNFLIDKNISKKIVKLLDLAKGDFVLEIGPGEGALTEFILESGAELTAVEIDERAIELLTKRFPKNSYPNFNLVHQDFSQFNIQEYASGLDRKIKTAGNIPYYLSSEILFKLFENSNWISNAAITMQKEVAQRLVSKSGSKVYGILSVAAEMVSKRKIAFDIPGGAFRPAPKVTSSVVLLNFYDKAPEKDYYKKIMRLVKAAFNQRRKMISNSLEAYMREYNYKLDKERIDNEKIKILFSKRPEQLNLQDFKDLYSLISGH